jgi:hypothetical protein
MNTKNGRRVISYANLPMSVPLSPTLLMALVLDRVVAPGWVWGAVGVLMALVWAIWLHDVLTRVNTDILSTRKTEK